MNRLFFLMVIFVFFNGCELKVDGVDVVEVYNSDVDESLMNADQALRERRNLIEFSDSSSVDNCITYIQKNKNLKIKEDVYNQQVKNEYLICDVLELLGGRSYKFVSADKHYGKVIAERLDLRTFLSSLGPRLSDDSYTLYSIVEGNVKAVENSAIYENDDWFLSIEVVASADIDSDGIVDWIVWHVDEAKYGNYKSYQTLVVSNIKGDEYLSVK